MKSRWREAAGPLLPGAIEDLGALPLRAHERAVAEQILLNLRHALGGKPSLTPEDQEFVMRMHDTWEMAWERGRTERLASDVLTVLRARAVSVPDAVRDRILAQKDPALLERWLEKAATATTLADVLVDPSRRRATKRP